MWLINAHLLRHLFKLMFSISILPSKDWKVKTFQSTIWRIDNNYNITTVIFLTRTKGNQNLKNSHFLNTTFLYCSKKSFTVTQTSVEQVCVDNPACCDLEMTNTCRKWSILAGSDAQEVDSPTANVGAIVRPGCHIEHYLLPFFLNKRKLYRH